MPATLTRPRTTPNVSATSVALVESYAVGGEGQNKLKIDEVEGVIYGVKMCGRKSPNCHGIRGVTEGTEYTVAALKEEAKLCEGIKSYPKHAKRTGKPEERGAFESIGVFRNVRYDPTTDDMRGDFHYAKSHPSAPQLVEDVTRKMGRFGFSHHIPPGKFKSRIQGGKLIIESISEVKSVDLVDDPATTRNLWESQAVSKPFREILESFVAKKSAKRKAYAVRLLEDDMPLAGAADMPVDADPEAAGDPEDELWTGFKSAIMAILDGDGSAADKAKKIGQYLKAHEKLTGEPEPEPAAAEADMGDGEPDDKEKKMAESKEVGKLKAENACLKAGIRTPTPALLEALASLDTDAKRKELLEAYKPADPKPAPTVKPKSGGPGGGRLQGLNESKAPADAEAFAKSIR